MYWPLLNMCLEISGFGLGGFQYWGGFNKRWKGIKYISPHTYICSEMNGCIFTYKDMYMQAHIHKHVHIEKNYGK